MMTHKERVQCSLRWQDPDRVPVRIYATPEIGKQLENYFGGDYAKALDVDLWPVSATYQGKVRPAQGDIAFDIWGIGYRQVQHSKTGAYSEAVCLPWANITTMDDVEKYPWPNPYDFDFSTIAAQCDRLKEYSITYGDASTPDIVNGVSRGRGMEQVLMDIALRDEVGLAIIDKRVDFYFEHAKRALEAGKGKIDILCLGEDCGNQNGRMVSPKDFGDVFYSRLKKFYDLAHHYGAKAMMHSCGDTHELMPTFIEMGLDILDAMQPEPRGMNPETIRRICKGKLAFCGLISTQQTLPYGTVAQCRAEARHRLDVVAKGGGYIFAPAHCIQPDTPLENILAIYEEALGRTLIK